MDDLSLWTSIRQQQEDIFQRKVQEAAALSSQVQSLQSEVSYWKQAYSDKEQELEAATGAATASQIRERSPLDARSHVVCIIDGESLFFTNDLVSRGREGGLQAATLLRSIIKCHLLDRGAPADVLSATIICAVYVNTQRASVVSGDAKGSHSQIGQEFMEGFNASDPLWAIVDVHADRETVVAKIRATLKLYESLPHTRGVFFGSSRASHYATYAGANENPVGRQHYNKIMLVTGGNADGSDADGDMFAHQPGGYISALGVLSERSVNQTFSRTTLSPNETKAIDVGMDIAVEEFNLELDDPADQTPRASFSPTAGTNPDVPNPPQTALGPDTPLVSPLSQLCAIWPDAEEERVVDRAEDSEVVIPGTRRVDPTKSFLGQTPSACVFFYFASGGCLRGDDCSRGHDYSMTRNELISFRQQLAGTACPVVSWNNHGQHFPDQKCPWSHLCPYEFRTQCPRPSSAKKRCRYEHLDD